MNCNVQILKQANSERFIHLSELLHTMNVAVKASLYSEYQLESDRPYPIILIEHNQEDWTELVPAKVLKLAKHTPVVIFAAESSKICEKLALLAQLKGVFYKTDAPDVILKGLYRIFNDELWFQRTSLTKAIKALLENANQEKSTVEDSANDAIFDSLTKREKSIVRLIYQGAQNKDIASHLHISLHTVKTHLYSAFKKTNCRNRFELIRWTHQSVPDAVKHESYNAFGNPPSHTGK